MPDSGHPAPRQVRYHFEVYCELVPSCGVTATLNGVEEGGPGTSLNPNPAFGYRWYLTQPYDGSGSFQDTGRITASAGAENAEASSAGADLWIVSITMLDAQGQVVTGTLANAVPEPAFWPISGLIGLGLVLLGKRRTAG